MIRRTLRLAFLLIILDVLCGHLYAQADVAITVRMMDAKTGHLIQTSNFLVRVDHVQTVHADWVRLNEDGTGNLKLTREASLLSIHATYDNAMEIYVNCDSAGDKPSPMDRWYKVSEILESGVVAPNACSKLKEIAKPGEFVFFVRRTNWKEQLRDYEP
jgi:hypothetical protein